MNAPQPAIQHLADQVALKISGKDARSFLQGQLTQDLHRLSAERAWLTGWTSPKGRLYFVSPIIEWRDAIWLTVPAETAGTIIQRLRMFVLRADVAIEESAMQIAGVTGDADLGGNGGDGACVIRLPGDDSRRLIIADSAGDATDRSDAWRLANIRAGLPTIWPQTYEAFVPQQVNLDVLDGISFSKGCYVGQEIIARTQNLGRIKRRMFRLSAQVADALEPGGTIYNAEGSAGRIVDVAASDSGAEMLAVISLDRIGTPLFADESLTRPLERLDLPYSFPESLA